MQSRTLQLVLQPYRISGRAAWCGLALLVCLGITAGQAKAIPIIPLPPPQHFGNDQEFDGTSGQRAGFLLGTKISVPSDLLLISVGIIFKTAGYSANVGIYSDLDGHPADLLATTDPFAVVTTGAVEAPVTAPLNLPAGDYWFQAVYSGSASVGTSFDGEAQVDYVAHSFSNPLPATAPWNSYLGQPFNYYLVGYAAAVPEPSTIVLLGSGLIGLVAVARGRRSRARRVECVQQ